MNQRSERWSWPRNWTTTKSEENLEITKFKHFGSTLTLRGFQCSINFFDITYQLLKNKNCTKILTFFDAKRIFKKAWSLRGERAI